MYGSEGKVNMSQSSKCVINKAKTRNLSHHPAVKLKNHTKTTKKVGSDGGRRAPQPVKSDLDKKLDLKKKTIQAFNIDA